MSTMYKQQPKAGDTTNYIGIEMEFHMPNNRDDLNKLRQLLVDKELNHLIRIDWEHICFEEPQYAFEATMLLPEDSYKMAIIRLISLLKLVGAYVSEHCGLHIHVDSRYRNRIFLYDQLVKSQDVLFDMVAEHRKNNQYCTKIDSNDKTIKNRQDLKHSAIFMATKYPTVEVRMFEATLDTRKIINWINTVLKIVDTE